MTLNETAPKYVHLTWRQSFINLNYVILGFSIRNGIFIIMSSNNRSI